MNVALYSGRDFLQEGNEPFTQKVVVDQLTSCRLFEKGYHVFTDNYYTKIPLALKLYDKNTFLTGTINKNSKGLSKKVVSEKLGVEKSVYFRQNKILVVGYKQKVTRKPVYLLTTGLYAEDKLIRSVSGLAAKKPSLINSYNKHMGGVDVSDKTIYHVISNRPSHKYWKQIFTNLLDISLHNAYLLYSMNTDKPKSRADFLEQIVETLAEVETLVQPGPQGDGGHALVHLPGRKERLCAVCSDDPSVKRKRSCYWCPSCNCGVHPTCYHKLQHFLRNNTVGKKRAHPEDD